MAFMQPQIVDGQYWEIETPNGTSFIPVDVVGDQGLNEGDSFNFRFPTPQEKLEGMKQPKNLFSDYCESGVIYSATLCEGVLGRLSAPGFMDCTEWQPYSDEKEAEFELSAELGEEEEEDDGDDN